MKRVILLTLMCAALSMQLPLQAQNMEVVDFHLLETDMTAQAHGTEKFDDNGDRAALIKIVTSERDFTFDAGSLGIVDRETHTGEIWLYVPRQSKKLTIKHPDYGVTRDYFYPIEILGGRTYEMLIDLGIGRYVMASPQMAGSTIYVDGENCGVGPLKPRYLNYGRHTVRALKDRYEGEATFVITPNDEKRIRVVNIAQRDMSDHFGDVTVTVDGNADIYFENRLVGNSTWQTQLREGSYVVETRKADCDPVKTSFTVVAQKDNQVKANAPIPHTGWLQVYTRPRNVLSSPFDVSEPQSLPVGTYQLEFTRKGFVTQNKEYTVRRNETTTDTVTLERVTYVKPLAFYFGGAATIRALTGISGIVGVVYQRHDLQASYTFGMKESDVVYFYNGEDVESSVRYKMNSISLKYGYQFNLLHQLAITPQVGYAYNFLTGTAVEGSSTHDDGVSSNNISIGVKLLAVPFQHFYLFVAPEYSFALSKTDSFDNIAKSADFSADGFAVHAGILVNF